MDMSEALVGVVDEFLKENFQDAVQRSVQSYHFWKRISDVLNPDYQGRVSLRPTLLASRKKATALLFEQGKTREEIAKSLKISMRQVEHSLNGDYTAKKR